MATDPDFEVPDYAYRKDSSGTWHRYEIISVRTNFVGTGLTYYELGQSDDELWYNVHFSRLEPSSGFTTDSSEWLLQNLPAILNGDTP